jgi:hypothetical protein
MGFASKKEGVNRYVQYLKNRGSYFFVPAFLGQNENVYLKQMDWACSPTAYQIKSFKVYADMHHTSVKIVRRKRL